MHRADMDDDDDDGRRPQGCGLLGGIYNNIFRRPPPPSTRRSSSTNSLRNAAPRPESADPKLARSDSKRRHSTDSALASANIRPSEISAGPTPANSRTPAMPSHPKRAARGGPTSGGANTLVRASSGNVMIYGNLGNIRAPGAVTPSRNVLDYLPKTAEEKKTVVAPVVVEEAVVVPGSMCRALSRRVDPEEWKEMGNEEYKKGNFAEAVELYDRAILMDSQKAAYWSNKAAALVGLGKLLDAVVECREAVRIDPCYHRAHHRLATVYLRLGEADRALHHLKLSRNEASSSDMSKAQALQVHLSKCSEARRLKDWHAELKESQAAISVGADSSPKVFAFKAEALIMLGKHEEADTTLSGSPKFDIDACTNFFGAITNAYVLVVQAQVDMAAGRFDAAVSIANRAARLDTSSREAAFVARKARTVASARAAGNDLFKSSRFEEACAAYGEGLSHDSNNAILLCNRAACRSKIGQLEKAIEDCNAALNLRPSYNKARLRRADCNAKLKRWEASVQDYEALLRDMPEDEEVGKALQVVRVELRKQQGEVARS